MPKRVAPPTAELVDPLRTSVLRRDVLAALDELDVATEESGRLFDRLRTQARHLRPQIERGAKASDLTHSLRISDCRAAVSQALTRIEKARHQFQRAMFLLAAAEGASLADIARAWGISRQLVSRMTREPD
jgi:DNA-directed RNA polymerase specialized sigma24 family protein